MLTIVKIAAVLKVAGAAALFYHVRKKSKRKKLVRWAIYGERA